MAEVDPMALLTASQAAMYAGHVDHEGKPKVNVIVNWRNRRLLPVATDDEGREIRDGRGRPYYRLADVARADALTTKRGEAMALSLLARRAPAVALPGGPGPTCSRGHSRRGSPRWHRPGSCPIR